MRFVFVTVALAATGCGGDPVKPPAHPAPIVEPPAAPAVDVGAEIRHVLVLPRVERVAKWRAWSLDPNADARLVSEAAIQLARLGDGTVLLRLLATTTEHSMVSHLAAALLEVPNAELTGPAPILQTKLANAKLRDRAQLAVALVHVGDKASFGAILDAHRSDDLAIAQTLDGSPAFDALELANLATHDTWRTLAKDPSPRVRKLVATALSIKPEAADDEVLAALVLDSDLDVATEAMIGCARRPSGAARLMLTKRLGDFEKDDNEQGRVASIRALERGLGGAGLLFALSALDDIEGRARFILERVRALRDPSAASVYREYLKNEKNPPHYRAQIALALADLGDVDAAPYLAWRMTATGKGAGCNKSPKCRSANLGWSKFPPTDADPVTFREQTSSARALGDLAVLHPDKRAAMLAVAAGPIAKFDSWFPGPWLQTKRALAYLGDEKTFAWAKKTVQTYKLPPESMVSFDTATIFAMSDFTVAARYVGYAGDINVSGVLLKHLGRPLDKKGFPIKLGMADMELAYNPGFREAMLRATEAAADGLAEWGPAVGGAVPHLTAVMRDRDHGLYARLQAARAIGRITSDAQLLALVKEARAWTDHDARVGVLMAAYHRSNAALSAAALEYLHKTDDPSELAVMTWAARVVGFGDVTALAPKLLALLEDPGTRVNAALAIMLGGDEELVTRAMLTFGHADSSALRALFIDTFAFREVVAVDVPRLSRVAHNVDRMRRIGAIADVTDSGRSHHAWAADAFEEALSRLELGVTTPRALDETLLFVEVLRAKDLRLLRYLRAKGALFADGSAAARLALREIDTSTIPDTEPTKADPYVSRPKK